MTMNNNSYFNHRHEIEKAHAVPIKGQVKLNGDNSPSWPEILISKPPQCSADVWIQLVQHKNHPQGDDNPCPSPNRLFIKKGKDWSAPQNGITITDPGDGSNDDGHTTKEADGKIFSINYIVLYCNCIVI